MYTEIIDSGGRLDLEAGDLVRWVGLVSSPRDLNELGIVVQAFSNGQVTVEWEDGTGTRVPYTVKQTHDFIRLAKRKVDYSRV